MSTQDFDALAVLIVDCLPWTYQGGPVFAYRDSTTEVIVCF